MNSDPNNLNEWKHSWDNYNENEILKKIIIIIKVSFYAWLKNQNFYH